MKEIRGKKRVRGGKEGKGERQKERRKKERNSEKRKSRHLEEEDGRDR